MSFFRKAGSDSSDSDSSSEEELLSDSGDDSGLEAKVAKTTQSSSNNAAATSSGGVKKSRFAMSSGSDSDSDSDDSDDDDDDSDAKADPATTATATSTKKVSKFARGASSDRSSDESEDEGRKIVKSAKSKRAEELEMGVKKVENAAKIDDWVTVNTGFDNLTRLVATSPGNVLAIVTIPALYLKAIVSLDQSIQETSSKKKKLNATHSKALNGMKQKVKKAQREHEDLITRYKADPEAYEREVEGEDKSTQTEAPKKKKKKTVSVLVDQKSGDEDEEFTTVGKGGKAVTLSADNVLKTLQSILEARGKKATDRAEQVKILERVLAIAATPYAKIRVLLALISSLFDYNTGTHAFLPLDQWSAARTRLDELFQLLQEESASYVVQEQTEDYDEMEERAPTPSAPIVKIRGSILSLAERLDDEFTKSLKDIDPHAVDYVERLKDEKKVYESLAKAGAYLERVQLSDSVNRITLRRLEHVYNKPDAVIVALEEGLPPLQSAIWPSPAPSDVGSGQLVKALCTHLYKPTCDYRLRSRAMLCHVFHFAMHNQFYKARDMLLMSHVHHSVHTMEVETQILYNRVIAQLGLSAFRAGLIEETESLLRDLYSNPTLVRERLAQGVQRRGPEYQLTPEQEKLEKARQLPFHQHINLELLECAYLVSSMLIEVPQIALETYDPERKRDVKSRMFRRQLDSFDRQIFAGPPENKREHVVQAAKALQAGEWKKSIELIESIKIWSLMPGEKEVKRMLAQKNPRRGSEDLSLFSHCFLHYNLSHLPRRYFRTASQQRSVACVWHDLE